MRSLVTDGYRGWRVGWLYVFLYGSLICAASAESDDPREQAPTGQKATDGALVYVLRPSAALQTVPIWSFVDERPIAVTRGRDHTRALVPAGSYLFWSKSDNIAVIELELERGRTYYIRQFVYSGERNARVELKLLSADRGPRFVESSEERQPKPKELTRGQAIAAKYWEDARAAAAEQARVARAVEHVRRSVVRVETEDGYACGFLFDRAGLIQAGVGLHAAHFEASEFMGAMPPFSYEPSSHIQVVLGAKRKARAQLLRYDASSGVAILRIHPDLVERFEVAALASQPPAKRDHLVAVCPRPDGVAAWASATVRSPRRGRSPTFHVDVDLDRRDMGCPLFDLDGGVAGTYFAQAFPEGSGPERELERIVLASEAVEELREEARAELSRHDPPPAELLPSVPDRLYPGSLAKSVAANVDPQEYLERSGALTLEFLTPPLLRRLDATDMIPPRTFTDVVHYKPESGFFGWAKYARSEEAVVVVQAVPSIAKVPTSWKGYLGGLWALLNPSDRAFQPDFRRLELLRDDAVVEPIQPRRVCGRFTVHTRSPSGNSEWNDKLYGCYGSYVYSPDVFLGEAVFRVRVWTSGLVEEREFVIPEHIVERIRADFQPYFRLSGATQD